MVQAQGHWSSFEWGGAGILETRLPPLAGGSASECLPNCARLPTSTPARPHALPRPPPPRASARPQPSIAVSVRHGLPIAFQRACLASRIGPHSDTRPRVTQPAKDISVSASYTTLSSPKHVRKLHCTPESVKCAAARPSILHPPSLVLCPLQVVRPTNRPGQHRRFPNPSSLLDDPICRPAAAATRHSRSFNSPVGWKEW